MKKYSEIITLGIALFLIGSVTGIIIVFSLKLNIILGVLILMGWIHFIGWIASSCLEELREKEKVQLTLDDKQLEKIVEILENQDSFYMPDILKDGIVKSKVNYIKEKLK